MNIRISIEIDGEPEDMEAMARLSTAGTPFGIAKVESSTGERDDAWTGMFFGGHGWISWVKPDSPAYSSGIMASDVIYAIDGMRVCLESHQKWLRSIASTQAGEPLFVDIVCPVSVDPAGFKRHVLRRPGPVSEVSRCVGSR